MKKIILLLMSILLITGCGAKTLLTLDLDKAKKDIEELKIKDDYLYSKLDYVTSGEIKDTYQFEAKYFDEFVIAMPKIKINANMYMILKVKKGKMTEAKNELAHFDEKYIEQWKLYLPDQAKLVENKLETQKDDYLIYIVSSDNNKVLKAILNSK